MVRAAVVGLGKMGLSHQAILNAHPEVDLVGVCDSSSYLLGVLEKYTGVRTYGDLGQMLRETRPDLLLVATPSSHHASMVRLAIDAGVHVFCEKPFCLDTAEGVELARAASQRRLVTQVGYHNRFVATFQEVKKLLDHGAIGHVTHILAEAYGPVVLRTQGSTWRSKRSEGGGCLYDYAAHPINLVNWYLGMPTGVGGTVLNRVFSREIDDEVSSTMYFSGGTTAQLSTNWSDESARKMTTRITIWGTGGRLFADRQEIQAYLREPVAKLSGYQAGWNIKYTTELTKAVAFYLRGEEYSAQIAHFVERVKQTAVADDTDFSSAVITDRVISLMIDDATKGSSTPNAGTGLVGTSITHAVRPPRRDWGARTVDLAADLRQAAVQARRSAAVALKRTRTARAERRSSSK